MNKTIGDAKYLIEDSHGVRIWKVTHEWSFIDNHHENTKINHQHWYSLIYNYNAPLSKRLWPNYPFKQEFFDLIVNGEHKDLKILFDEKDALVLKLKYGFTE